MRSSLIKAGKNGPEADGIEIPVGEIKTDETYRLGQPAKMQKLAASVGRPEEFVRLTNLPLSQPRSLISK